MPSLTRIDVTRILDSGRLGVFLAAILAVCALLMFLDGYDALGIVVAAPHIARQWHVEPSSFGPVFALGPLGMLFGGIGFGFLGDYYGRKSAIIVSTLSFGVPILRSLTRRRSSRHMLYFWERTAGLGHPVTTTPT